jgi:hypothetical protein
MTTERKRLRKAVLARIEASARDRLAAGIDATRARQTLALVAEVREARATIRQLWDTHDAQDMLEGKDSEYGPRMLTQRKAWQRAARILEVKGE